MSDAVFDELSVADTQAPNRLLSPEQIDEFLRQADDGPSLTAELSSLTQAITRLIATLEAMIALKGTHKEANDGRQ